MTTHGGSNSKDEQTLVKTLVSEDDSENYESVKHVYVSELLPSVWPPDRTRHERSVL